MKSLCVCVSFRKHHLNLVWFVMFGFHILGIFVQCNSAASFPSAKAVPALQHSQGFSPTCCLLLAVNVVRVS